MVGRLPSFSSTTGNGGAGASPSTITGKEAAAVAAEEEEEPPSLDDCSDSIFDPSVTAAGADPGAPSVVVSLAAPGVIVAAVVAEVSKEEWLESSSASVAEPETYEWKRRGGGMREKKMRA